jgi:hypothetical protein
MLASDWNEAALRHLQGGKIKKITVKKKKKKKKRGLPCPAALT